MSAVVIGRTALRCALAMALLLTSWLVAADETKAPAWFRAELARLTAHGGLRLADNTAYRSDAEPFDAYGVVWMADPDGSGATARLFAQTQGREVAEFWRFSLRWNAASGHADLVQTGQAGTVGRGTLSGFGEATLMEQEFTLADGRKWRELHHAWFEGDTHVTRAYDWADGAWIAGRTYRWELVSPPPPAPGGTAGMPRGA